jgi:hypothetical protein
MGQRGLEDHGALAQYYSAIADHILLACSETRRPLTTSKPPPQTLPTPHPPLLCHPPNTFLRPSTMPASKYQTNYVLPASKAHNLCNSFALPLCFRLRQALLVTTSSEDRAVLIAVGDEHRHIHPASFPSFRFSEAFYSCIIHSVLIGHYYVFLSWSGVPGFCCSGWNRYVNKYLPSKALYISSVSGNKIVLDCSFASRLNCESSI